MDSVGWSRFIYNPRRCIMGEVKRSLANGDVELLIPIGGGSDGGGLGTVQDGEIRVLTVADVTEAGSTIRLTESDLQTNRIFKIDFADSDIILPDTTTLSRDYRLEFRKGLESNNSPAVGASGLEINATGPTGDKLYGKAPSQPTLFNPNGALLSWNPDTSETSVGLVTGTIDERIVVQSDRVNRVWYIVEANGSVIGV
jgi:hypothetical protein